MNRKEFDNIDWNRLAEKPAKILITGNHIYNVRYISRNIGKTIPTQCIDRIVNAANFHEIHFRNGSKIHAARTNEIGLKGYRFDTIYFLGEISKEELEILRPCISNLIIVKSNYVRRSIETLAKRVCETTYPERRKWEEIGAGAQEEWIKFCENCVKISDDMKDKGEL